MDGLDMVPGLRSMAKSCKLQASTSRATSGKLQAPSVKLQAGLDKALALGYSGIMSIKLQTSNLFRTFKTQKEVADYIDMHNLSEEKRLLWMGFMFGCNYSANQVNENFILKKK